MKGGFTPCQRCTENSEFSRLQITTSYFVKFLAIKPLAPWRSLTSVYPLSFHNRVLSETLTIPCISLTSGGNSDRPQYIRIACTSLGKIILRGLHSTPKRSTSPPAGALTKSSPQSIARHVPKSGQARRQSVEPPGSNTRICFDFALMSLRQKEEGGRLSFRSCSSTRRVELMSSRNSTPRSGKTEDAVGNRWYSLP